MELLVAAVLVFVWGVCYGDNLTRTDQNSTSYENKGYGSSRYNQGTNRPPSGIHYLDLINFEEPIGDENGFRIYLRMENSEHWNHVMEEATITIDDGYQIEKILKKIEIENRNRNERWIDFTKYSCNRKTQSIVVSLHDDHHRAKDFEIPTKLLFGREATIARVEAVYPEDKIQLWTRNSVKSHCFHGGSVTVTKNGRNLIEAELVFSHGQYTFILRDGPGSECQDVQYDLTITSRYGWNLGVARLSREDNKVSLDLEGKVMTANTLDGFLLCTSRAATVREILDPISQTIQSNSRRQFSLQPFLTRCQESVLQVEYLERGKHSLEIVHVPRDITIHKPSEEIREIKIADDDFHNCAETKIELQCYEDEAGKFVSIQNFTTTNFSVKEYLKKTCKIRVWMDPRYLKYAQFYTILDPLSTLAWILIGVGIGVVVLVIIVVIGVCLARRKSSSRSRRGERGAGAEMVQLRGSTPISTDDTL